MSRLDELVKKIEKLKLSLDKAQRELLVIAGEKILALSDMQS